MKIIPETSHVN